MSDKLDRTQQEELSPDEYLGEDPQENEQQHMPGGQLLSSRELAESYKKDEQLAQWEKELDRIGSHWVTLRDGDDSDPNMQVGRAWVWAYVGLRVCCTKYFSYRTDQDTLITYAMDRLEEDIRKFDPAKSTLSKRMKAQFKNRLSDAMRRAGGPRDRAAWQTELTQFQFDCPETEQEREAWCDQLMSRIFRFYRRRVDSCLRDGGQRQAARAQLKKILMRFDPESMSLVRTVAKWVDDTLDGDRQDQSVVSLDAAVGEDGDAALIDLIPAADLPRAGEKSAARRQLERQSLAGRAMELIARELNYQLLADPNAIRENENHRFNRMCYTERMVYFALTDSLPDFNRKDMYHALMGPYLDFFSRMPPDEPRLRLEKLQLRTREEILDPDSDPDGWTTQLAFTGKNMYLQAFVPRIFLQRGYHQTLSDSRISKMRGKFHSVIREQLYAHYSPRQLHEICFDDYDEEGTA